MRFQLPPRPESLNHIPIPYVNSLSVKLIDGKDNSHDYSHRSAVDYRYCYFHAFIFS
jgi:hypothetical protein